MKTLIFAITIWIKMRSHKQPLSFSECLKEARLWVELERKFR